MDSTAIQALQFQTVQDQSTAAIDLEHLFAATYPGRWARSFPDDHRVSTANASVTVLKEGTCSITFTDLDGFARAVKVAKGTSYGAIVELAQALNALIEDVVCPF